MLLQRLTVRNFRNIEEATFTFSPQVNVICGANAQGKTNLLEAIHMLSGKSFRTAHLQDLVREGQLYFYIAASFLKDGIPQTAELYYEGSARKLKINDTEYDHFSALLGLIPSVLLTPDDPKLIDGPPKERRNYLDTFLAQGDPLYVHHLIRYHKAMRHKNHLLKARKPHTLEIWERNMAVSGAYLIEKRKNLISSLKPLLAKLASELSEGWDAIGAIYHTSHTLGDNSLEEQLMKTWHALRSKEQAFGTTLAGPHRDDVHFFLKDKPARIYASEGQKKTLAVALRLVQWQLLKEMVDALPILSLDDFGSHLDSQRYALLKDRLNHFGQVFITLPTVESEDSPFPNAHTICIANGQLVEATTPSISSSRV